MAKDDPQILCDRLLSTFVAPLVMGGTMRPGNLVGGRRALALGDDLLPSDADLLHRIELARVRVARKLAPIDVLAPAPSGAEWAMAALLHDVVQATHPAFDAAFRRSGPRRVLDVVDRALAHVPRPQSIGEALSRHTWFSRMFEVCRTDVSVSWWTGSEQFLGEDPPKRLTAWPELRRVTETRTPRHLMELPTSGAIVDADRFVATVEAFLRRTPLTDLATMTRASPEFTWTEENLSIVGVGAGTTLTMRALEHLAEPEVDRVLGRATKQLLSRNGPVALVTPLLRDRALYAATARIGRAAAEPLTPPLEEDAAFARTAGSIAAVEWLRTEARHEYSEAVRRELERMLTPAAARPEDRALLG